ncbi:MAG: DUF2182 domain-containing protein [Pikeienuella sp.]
MRGSSGLRLDDPRLLATAAMLVFAGALWIAVGSVMGAADFWLIELCRAGFSDPAPAEATRLPGLSARLILETWAMWTLMMSAMMLPSTGATLAAFADVARIRATGAALAARVALFLGGYLLVWAGFSLIAALAQLGLRGGDYFSLDGAVAGPLAGGALLLAAGLWQLAPIKQSCLVKCRQPMVFLMSAWRPGALGAAAIGLRHGVHCLGCCALLMALMFVFGAMNLWWMAAIALYCIAEKLLPGAESWGRAAGLLMLGAGAAMIGTQI